MTKTKSQKARAKQAKKNANRSNRLQGVPSVRTMRRLDAAVKQLMGDPVAGVALMQPPRANDIGLRRGAKFKRSGKRTTKGPKMSPAFLENLNANRDAFSAVLAPPFMSFNPEPSLEARAGRCTKQWVATVPAGEAYWILFGQTDEVNSDGQAKHVRTWLDFTGGGDFYALLPFTTTFTSPDLAKPAFAAARILPLNDPFSADLNANTWGSGSADAVQPLSAWPISQVQIGNTNHQRAMWTCWGVSASNVTPVGTRGGTHITVSPAGQSTVAGHFTLETLPLQPSYKEHSQQQLVRTFHARPHDLSYAHVWQSTTAAGSAAGKLTNPAGIYVFRNDTAAPQTIKFVCAAKYAVAGQAAAAVVEPVDLAPQHASHYEAAAAHVTGGAVGPEHFDAVAKLAHVAQATGTSLVDKVGKLVSNKAAEVATGLMAGVGFAAA